MTRNRYAIAVTSALATLFLILFAGPSQAFASYQWSKTQMTLDPIIYQTNLTYYTATFVPPGTVTADGVIDQSSHPWRVWDGAGINGTLQVLACTVPDNLCTDVTGTPTTTTTANGTLVESTGFQTTAFAGLPATTQFRYALRVNSGVTKTLPQPMQSSQYRIAVDWHNNA